MPCVVGKSILVSRRALEAIGGIGVLRDYLAEDFLLGRAVRREGFAWRSRPTTWTRPKCANGPAESGTGIAAGR